MKEKANVRNRAKGNNSKDTNNKLAPKSKFQTAVEATPQVSGAYMTGLKALAKSSSSKISLGQTNNCEGSLNIDSSVLKHYPNDNRWDYCFSYKSEVYFVEVHSAESSQVSVVIDKLKWLKDWLLSQAPEINILKAKSRHPYYWIQSGRFAILPNSSHYRAAIQANIKPIPVLRLE